MGLEPTTTGITTLDSTFELRPPLQSELACPAGLEPTTPSLEGWCSIRLSYRQSASKATTTKTTAPKSANSWSGREDLNLRHLAPKASALPGCATPRKWRQMILLAHLPSNADCLRQGCFSATKSLHFFGLHRQWLLN